MLRNARSIRGYNLLVGDEVVAECQDILVDSSWRKVQYVLARLSHPPEARMILVPTSLAGEPSWDRQGFPLHVAYEDLERMVYTEKEGAGHVRSSHARSDDDRSQILNVGLTSPSHGESAETTSSTLNLWSVERLSTLEVRSLYSSETLGHVFDWIIEDGNWSPRFLAVCLSPERDDVKVLISHLWVKHVDLQNNTVQLRLTPEEIQRSPKYDPNEAVNRRYELRTYDFTGRPINWGVTSE